MDRITRLQQLAAKPERMALGLMSGMSVDGLDLALVRIRSGARRPQVTLEASRTVPYADDLRGLIRAAVEGHTRDVSTLSFILAERWAEDVLEFLADEGVSPTTVDVLGSHGQTVDHVSAGGAASGASLQIGDGDVLAERTGILTVSEFRSRDIAAGGEGAPLVPVADWILFGHDDEVVACQNLGSIANVTVVTEALAGVEAFDSGPANVLIDGLVRLGTGVAGAIDEDGTLSAKGRVHEKALAFLREASRAFLDRAPPKSAGFDDFGPALARRVHEAFPDTPTEDLVRTAVVFTAVTIGEAYARFVVGTHPTLRRVVVTGGGAANPTLMAEIRRRLSALGLTVEVPEDAWAGAKEAVAFALLADRTVRGLPGNAPRATGARHPVVLGKISL